MEKNVIISILFEYYGKLLTEKQAQVIELYYEEDLSLTEIAEILGVSKQNVSETIKRSEKFLLEYEENLKLVERLDKITDLVNVIEENLIEDLNDEEYSRYIDLIFQIKNNLK